MLIAMCSAVKRSNNKLRYIGAEQEKQNVKDEVILGGPRGTGIRERQDEF